MNFLFRSNQIYRYKIYQQYGGGGGVDRKCFYSNKPTMAIRRETVNVWERRAPLAPSQVRRLVKDGIRVLVQPSNRRAFTAQEYINAGAIIQEDLSSASLIIGVKQVPLDRESLMPNKTYAFFSHTIKAQEGNMPLLDAILDRNIRLIDYERMLDENNQRVVAFGQFAGIAGMINILHGLGLRFLAQGSHTPFMHIGPAHNYRSVGMARQAIRDAGYEIALGNMPKSIGPLTFVFTGSGNVSNGAQEMFMELPFEFVEPEHLHKVATKGATNKMYGCVVSRNDHIRRRTDGGFDPDEFDNHPERYISTFANRFAPYASVIINGIYFAPNAPRLISIPDAKHLLRVQEHPPWLETSPGCPSLPHRLVAICDISADPGGSIEFMKECTTIDKPFCLYDAEENMSYEKFDGPGVLICSIDNMPAQLPREATHFFGDLLVKYVYDMIKSDATKPFDKFDISNVVKNAVIATNGSLAPNYEYISSLRESRRQSAIRQQASSHEGYHKSVLILGAGYVVPPLLDYLHRQGGVNVTLASAVKQEVVGMADRFNNVTPEVLDILSEKERLDELVKSHDLVISMVPYKFHEIILNNCLKNKVNILTASYCTPNLRARAAEIESAGITALMEVGLDPGIDHMLAMECFDDVRDKGGKILSYTSYTGGLPAPEFSENPLRYKFSWSPEAALVTAVNPAKFIENGKVKEIPAGGDLMLNTRPVDVLPGFNLECYANRDATVYGKLYGIEGAQRIIRGTLRYRGYSDVMWALIQLGFISQEADPLLHPRGPELTWKQYLAHSMGMRTDVFTGTLKDAVFERLAHDDVKFKGLVQLGLFNDDPIDKKGTPLATLANHLSKILAYGPNERDVVIMTHEVLIQWPDRKQEKRDIRFVVYGQTEEKGYLAMAKTVGIPTAIAAKMMIDGEIQSPGIHLPLTMDVYRPMLKRLKQEGLSAVEICTMIHE